MPIYTAWIVFEVISDDGSISRDARSVECQLVESAGTPEEIISSVLDAGPYIGMDSTEKELLVEELNRLAKFVEQRAKRERRKRGG